MALMDTHSLFIFIFPVRMHQMLLFYSEEEKICYTHTKDG